jgi:hypothetical protein
VLDAFAFKHSCCNRNINVPILCIAVLRTALVIVLVIIILVLVALLTPFVIVAVLLLMLAVIVGSVVLSATRCRKRDTVGYERFIIVGIALRLLGMLLMGGVVVVLAVLLVVVVPVLALLALSVCRSLAVAVIVLGSLRMSRHLGEWWLLRCEIYETAVNKVRCERGDQAETAAVGVAYLKQWALGAAEMY